MKITVEDVSAVLKRLIVDLPGEDVTAELDTVYRKFKKSAQIKGFRPGKAPRDILERYYGPQAEQEVMSTLIGKAYPQILEENKIDAISEPDIEKAEIGEDKTLHFEALVPIRPVIVPKDYKGISVEKRKAKVTDEQVDADIDKLREQHAEMVPVEDDRPLENGDFADIDFEGFLGDKPFPGGKADGHVLELGSGQFIPGFEEQLIGMKPGDNGPIKVTFPEKYHSADLAGKEVTFQITVNGIKKREIPEINDELAKSMEGAGASTVDELKEYIKNQLLENDEKQSSQDMRRVLAEKMIETNDFEVPPIMVDKQLEQVLANAKQQLLYGGLPEQQVSALVDGRRNEYRLEADKQVRFSLLLESIGEIEKVSVSDEELEKKLQEISELSGKPVEAISAEYQKENRMEILRDRLKDEKVIDLIVNSADVTEVDELTKPESDTEKSAESEAGESEEETKA